MKWLRIPEVLFQFAPAAIVAYLRYPVFVETTDKTITTAGLILILFAVLVFKDQVKEFFSTPSVFKISLIFFFIGLAAMQFGEQLYLLSIVTLAGSTASMPLTYIRKNQGTDDDLKKQLLRLVEKNESK